MLFIRRKRMLDDCDGNIGGAAGECKARQAPGCQVAFFVGSVQAGLGPPSCASFMVRPHEFHHRNTVAGRLVVAPGGRRQSPTAGLFSSSYECPGANEKCPGRPSRFWFPFSRVGWPGFLPTAETVRNGCVDEWRERNPRCAESSRWR